MAPQTAISKAVCYKTKNEQLWEKAVHFLFVATNCFYAGLPTDFCTITLKAGDAENAHFQAYNRKRSSFLNSFCAPPGARTLDPNIKSVVLYQLS